MTAAERVLKAVTPDVRVIAIDGRSASGKTSLSAVLAEMIGGEVVHMDDFFLPPHLRTAGRRGQPGGNVHYERFSIQVAPRLPWREPFSYQRFDCTRLTMNEWRQVPAVPVVFVEGAYALHPACRGEYGLKVFFDVSPQLQQQRIMQRNGPDQWVRFREEWIPMERLYQDTCKAYGCKAKIFLHLKSELRRKIGSPDLMILFTNTVSHKMVNCAMCEARRCNTVIARSHSSSLSALQTILEQHCKN